MVGQSTLRQFSFPFLEGPKNANFQSRFSDIRLKLFVRYLPNQKLRRINEDKLNKYEWEPMLFWEPKSRFHYLCYEGGESQPLILQPTIMKWTATKFFFQIKSGNIYHQAQNLRCNVDFQP